MGGKTSNASKNKWKARNYDILQINVPKGCRDLFKAACEAEGTSMSKEVKKLMYVMLDRNGLEIPEEAKRLRECMESGMNPRKKFGS